MASRIRRLFIDVVNRKLYTAFTGKVQATPDNFYFSDEEVIEVHAMQPNPDLTSNFPFLYIEPVGIVEIGLGLPDQLSTGGTFALTDTVATQTTSAIPYNATESAAQTSIRAGWPTNFGSCVVTKNNDGDFTIDRVTVGVMATNPTGDGSDLTPESFIGVFPVRLGTVNVSAIYRIVCLQKPVAFSSLTVADNPLPPAAVSVSRTQQGGTGKNAVFTVSINPDAYQGSFTLTSTALGASNDTTGTSAPVFVGAQQADIQSAVNQGFGAGNEVTATLINSYTWALEFTGTNVAGKDIGSGSMTGNPGNLTVPVGVSGTFDLRTSTALSLLGTALTAACYLEVRNDDGTYIQTWLQISAKINNTVIDPESTGATEFGDYITQQQADLRYLRGNPENANFRIKNGTEFQLWDATGNGWRTVTVPGGVLTLGVLDTSGM